MLKGGEKLELAGLEIDVLFTPGHSPGHLTFSIPARAGDLLRRRPVPGLGRTHRPAGRRLGHPADLDRRRWSTSLPRRDGGLSRPHGHHHARRRAPQRTRSWPSSPGDRQLRSPAPQGMTPTGTRLPRGTYDLLPEEAATRRRIVEEARRLAEGSGFGQIETPVFEDSDLFVRTVGEATDIVRKEMYTFMDRGDRSLTLRPEGTAPVCRAYIEHGMHKLPQPVKLWYTGPMFRYEAPQSGRYRQHAQVGARDDRLRRPGGGRRADRPARPPVRPPRPDGDPAAPDQHRRRRRAAHRVRARAARPPAAQPTSSTPSSARASRSTRCGRSTGTLRRHGPSPTRRRRWSTGSRTRTAQHFDEVRALLDGAGIDYERRSAAGARARLLHAHGVRVPLGRARRAERHRRRRSLRPADRADRRRADSGGRVGDRPGAHRPGDGRPRQAPAFRPARAPTGRSSCSR